MAAGNNSTLDTTELMTGKDGKLFVEVGGVNTFLAEINEFKVAMNVNTAEYQGVGSILVGTVPTGVTFDLTYTEAVIRDDVIMALQYKMDTFRYTIFKVLILSLMAAVRDV